MIKTPFYQSHLKHVRGFLKEEANDIRLLPFMVRIFLFKNTSMSDILYFYIHGARCWNCKTSHRPSHISTDVLMLSITVLYLLRYNTVGVSRTSRARVF